MERKDFIEIIKLRSFWKIDRRKGNYQLPNGEKLKKYVAELVESQLKIDGLGIASDGDLYPCSGGEWNDKEKKFDDYTIIRPFAENETMSSEEQEILLKNLVSEIVG